MNAPCIVQNCGSGADKSTYCVSGSVTADSSYHSAAGLSFYLRRLVGGPIGAVPIPVGIAITTYGGNQTGNDFLRVQLTDSYGNDYCVMENKWASGVSIPITKFNTACWDNSGVYASATSPMQELDLIVPSTGAGDRPFEFCLLDVAVQ